MAAINAMRAKLAAGKAVFGALVTMPSVPVVQALSRTGLDFVTIDLEHGPIDVAAAHAMIATTTGTGVTPLVRLPSASCGPPTKALLDAGAMGIELPLVKTRAELEDAVRHLRYAPRGERAWGPFYASLRWDVSQSEYVARANDELLVQLLVEHVTTIENLESLLATREVDVAFIAPGDLATSMGLTTGQSENPEVDALVRRAERIILESGVVLGGLAPSVEQAKARLDAGYRVLAVGVDFRLMQDSVRRVLEQLV
jgi:4-hydroxy-2-oxoheptanedioate aldolase